MSGIVAVFDRETGRFDDARLTRALRTLDHRGPDGRESWIDDAVGIGHQLLQTTPESTADSQPLCDHGRVLAADARLDNRPELRSALGLEDTAGPLSDSRLLLESVREWGTDCVDHLVGAYAFVVWNRAEGELFCARDHFGVKPLYYHVSADFFAVASEPKALLALPFVSPSLDETKVGDFLTKLFEDKTNTFYDTVQRLPPAHTLTVDGTSERQRRYWDLDPTRTLTLDSDRAYARRFRELFDRAISSRLRTDGSVASTLSGGLDSSSITAVAAEQLPPGSTLRTYSGVFEDAPESDEREYIETLVDRDPIEPSYVFMDGMSVLSDFDSVLEYHDEPVYNTMHYMKWEIAKRAKADGVDVVLDGAHGDSAVDYGLGLLPELARTGRWRQLVGELRALGDVLDRDLRGLAGGLILPNLVPSPAKRWYRRLRGRPPVERRANPMLDPSFARRVGLRSRHRRLDSQGSVLTRSARRWQYRSLMTGSMTSFLEANDVTHAAFGLEPRYPFIDKRLIEFSLAIPPTQQLSDGWTRLILRRAVGDVLPEKIQWRPWKTMMNRAFIESLGAADDELAALVEDPSVLRPYLDVSKLGEYAERFRRAEDMKSARLLWTALSLAVWLDHLDLDSGPQGGNQSSTRTPPSSER